VRGNTRRLPSARTREFLDDEARVEAGGSQDEEEEEEEEGEEEEGDGFLVPDADEEASTPSEHRRVDAILRERDAQSALPYFPLAFAVSDDRPLDFNFDLFLLDTLTLPRHIVSRGAQEDSPAQETSFADPASAIQYCRERLESGWKDTRPSSQDRTRSSSARLSHRDVDKWTLFRLDGRGLTKALQSGQEAFDANLKHVRLDR